jgi:hypothetical protein
MATSSIARGQITIVDLNDAKLVQVNLQANQSSVQNYNPDTKVYNPNWSSATPLILSPKIYQTGNSTDMITAGQCSGYKYTVDGTAYTSATADKTNFEVTSDGKLKIYQNLSAAFMEIHFECQFTDPETKQVSTLTADKTLSKNTGSSALLMVRLETAQGTIFDADTNATLNTLTCVAKAFRGGVQDTDNLTYTWEKFDIASAKWVAVATDKVSTASGVSTLTVSMDDVLDFQTFRCTVQDTADNQSAQDLVTFEDKTDPYQVEVVSNSGDKIVNGTGSTTVMARVYRSGNLVESETTAAASQQFVYTWTKYDKNGNIGSSTNTGGYWHGTTSATKTGNPITVDVADVDVRATISCEVSKK